MAVIVDTSFLIALRNAGDPNHRRAMALAQEIIEGQHGQPVVSDYIVAEILNHMSRGRVPAQRIREMLDELLGRGDEPWLGLVMIDQEMFDAAITLFEAMGVQKGLSFTDCTSILLARAMKAPVVASFDAGFDGVLGRLA